MKENQINIVLADDMEEIHSGLKDMVFEANKKSLDFKLNIIADFYNTEDLKDFLYEEQNIEPDILLLDIEFKGGESGIEALQDIREYAPGLEITLLSAYDDVSLVSPAIKEYKVKYLKKPISSNELLLHIYQIKEQQEQFEKLKDDLKLYEEWINRIEQDNDTKLPKNLSDVINKMFENIIFTKQALRELLACLDYKVYNILKCIDLKIQTNGMYPKVIKKEKIKNYDKITEYRFSQKGRIFVSYQDTKPIIVCIDPNHRVFA